jgi:hypothetical protein
MSEGGGDFLSQFLMIDEKRFQTPHGSLYLLGTVLIGGLFILNKISSVFSPEG